jgi:hypothetical protein
VGHLVRSNSGNLEMSGLLERKRMQGSRKYKEIRDMLQGDDTVTFIKSLR